MKSLLSPAGWARRAASHPRLAIAAWVTLFVAAIVIVGAGLSGALTTDNGFTRETESDRAKATFERTIGVSDSITESVVLTSPNAGDPALRRVAQTLERRVSGLGPSVVASVASPYSGGPPSLVSRSGRAVLLPVTMAGDANTARANADKLVAVLKTVDGTDGIGVGVTGLGTIDLDSNAVAESDLLKGEAIGIPIALIILLFVFGAVVSALLPVGLAIVAIVISLGLSTIVGQFFALSFFVTNMITMMGLAVGIDYVLFIVSRYREERGAGRERIEAIVRAGDTAGRAVLFSGITVVVALVGMLLVPMTIFVSLAVGAILVVLVAVAAATTLLPAMLALLGDRIDAGRVSRLLPKRFRARGGAGFWPRVIGAVMRRPVTSLVVGVALLLVAAVPYLSISTGAAGVSSLPPNLPSRVAYENLQRDFTIGNVGPARIPIVGDPSSAANRAEIVRITAAAASNPIFGPPEIVPSGNGRGAILSIPIRAEPTNRAATEAVAGLRRATTLPIGGPTAQNLDYFDISNAYLPIVVAIVLALSFLVLLVAFHSIVVPFVAIAMNLLSVGAAFGLLTLVTQEGVGAGLLGFQRVDTVEAWIPLFLFSVLFGLSMDYHVFLLSRIKERFDRSHDNRESITHGITSSARLITGAALIMVAVFGGFASGELVMFQQMGFGLGVAVLIDATVVRGVLVPAAMTLIGGERNWYLPRTLGWLPKLDVEGPRAGGVARD
ncbi:MAG: MMPL family transporter [Actinobacteria bacterium]|nr:MMPL family transporter [Actinomycetota bacterium]